jgi:hypothetical protein
MQEQTKQRNNRGQERKKKKDRNTRVRQGEIHGKGERKTKKRINELKEDKGRKQKEGEKE